MIIAGGTYWKCPGDYGIRGDDYVLLFPSIETAKIAVDLIKKTQKLFDMFDTEIERTEKYEKAVETFKEKVGSEALRVYDSSMRFLKKVCIGGDYPYCGGATIDILEPDEDGVFFV